MRHNLGRSTTKLTKADGTPKGLKSVLNERGINTANTKADDVRIVISFHDAFRHEKMLVLTDEGHRVLFLPNFHLGSSQALQPTVH